MQHLDEHTELELDGVDISEACLGRCGVPVGGGAR